MGGSVYDIEDKSSKDIFVQYYDYESQSTRYYRARVPIDHVLKENEFDLDRYGSLIPKDFPARTATVIAITKKSSDSDRQLRLED